MRRDFERGRHLGELDIRMLLQLDPDVVSRFAEGYLASMPDQPLRPLKNDLNLSEHEALYELMAGIGSSATGPAMARFAQVRREAAGEHAPHAIFAALAIANRAPWPGVDAFLGSLIERPVACHREDGPDLDLSVWAAALLVERHGENLDDFGIELLNTPNSPRFFKAYRFSRPQGREQVVRWWRETSARAKAPAAG